MFRSPNDVTSSDPESSSDDAGPALPNAQRPSRRQIQTSTEEIEHNAVSFGNDEEEAVSQNGQEPSVDWLPSTSDEHATLMTTALLEAHLNVVAAEALNESQGVNHYTRHSQQAQILGRTMYMQSSRQLASTGWIAPGVEIDATSNLRTRYLNLIDTLGIQSLMSLHGQIPRESGPGPQNLMVGRPADRVLHQAGPARHKLIQTKSDMRKLVAGLGHVSLPQSLSNLVGPSGPSQIMSRYMNDFQEIGFLGKGGYGSVYHAKHKVDNQDYAVKKIPLSPRHFREWQDGREGIGNILREIRTLARLEHANIVRYFNAWVEHPSTTHPLRSPLLSNPSMLGKLLQQGLGEERIGDQTMGNTVSQMHSRGFGSMPPLRSEEPNSFKVVFGEDTDSRAIASQDTDSGPSSTKSPDKQRRVRRASQGTIQSKTSRKSFVESAAAENEDVEFVPRSDGPWSNPFSTNSESPSDVFTDGNEQNHSQIAQVHSRAVSVPTVSLHIQMSLHPLSMATYLSPAPNNHTSYPSTSPRHCYHLLPSVQLLLCILSGVEYLHAKKIVHRDLKPGNIFLSDLDPRTSSISGPPPGSVDISECPQCCSTLAPGPPTTTTCLSPRIGDFGLVAEITQEGDVTMTPNTKDRHRRQRSSSPKSMALVASPASPSIMGRRVHTKHQPHQPSAVKHVGTEFYRPPSPLHSEHSKQCAHAIDAKIDVFALGVIFVELLHPFTTKMERMTVLKALTSCKGKDGRLPSDFSQRFVERQGACSKEVMGRVEECIFGMVRRNPAERWGCIEVRDCLEGVVRDLERRECS